MIELAVLGASQEGLDLRARVDQRRAARETGIPDGDGTLGKSGDLHAGPVGVAVLALLPRNVGQIFGRHAVIGVAHVHFQ